MKHKNVTPVINLWLACLAATRSKQPNGSLDVEALEEFLGQLDAAIGFHEPAQRAIERQSDAVYAAIRQARMDSA